MRGSDSVQPWEVTMLIILLIIIIVLLASGGGYRYNRRGRRS